MMLTRAPLPALAPFVERLWACDEPASVGFTRERVLPGRTIQIVVRLGAPLQVFDRPGDVAPRRIGHAVACGAWSTSYVRDRSLASLNVGARIHPEAAEAIFGAPADELAGRHTPLDALWGRAAVELRARLLESHEPARQLDLLERALLGRLTPRTRVERLAHFATARLAAGASVREVVSESGYSHRRFISLFQRGVGLTPKVHARVLRFRSALDLLSRIPSLAGAAFAAGYADHAHFTREFRGISGLTPREYVALAPAWSAHVPVSPLGSSGR